MTFRFRPLRSLWILTALCLTLLVPSAAAEGFSFLDPKGDVERDGGPYGGGAAPAMDVLSVRMETVGSTLWFQLELDDLSTLEEELDTPGMHAQYAVTFTTPLDERYSTRATNRGPDMGGDENGEWSFSIHDHANDEWPEVRGAIVEDAIEWRVPASMFGISGDATLTDWGVQTWISFGTGDQYGDWADTSRSADTTPGVSDASDVDPSADPSLEGIPGPATGLLVLGLALAARVAPLGRR